MKKLTKANIEQLAQEIMDFLDKHNMQDGVCIYYNNKRMHSEGRWKGSDIIYIWVEDEDFPMDPHDYFEYAAYDHILSMSFEGVLYDVLNYSCGKREEKFRAIFEKYGLYFELGNAWNLTAYTCDDNTEVEYTYYNKPIPVIDLYYHSKDTYPKVLANIMETWYRLAQARGDQGSCVIGAGFEFSYNDKKYFMNACSPWQGSMSWEHDKDIIHDLLSSIGAIDIHYNWGNMD